MALISRCIERFDVYEVGRYRYRVRWDERYGYTLQRRLAPLDDRPNYVFWDRGREVENYIQMGHFDPSSSARPVVRFSTIEEVEAVIVADAASAE